jgi:hypothetical protein
MIKKLLFAGHIRFKAHKLKAFQCSNSDSYCTTVRTVKTILGCFVQLDGVSRRGPYAHRTRLQLKYWAFASVQCPSGWYCISCLQKQGSTDRQGGRTKGWGLARVTNTRPSSKCVQCLGLAGTWDSITIMFLNSHRV